VNTSLQFSAKFKQRIVSSRKGVSEKRGLVLFLLIVTLLASVFATFEVKTSSAADTYGLDATLPSGSHVYVSYDADWTAYEKSMINSYLTDYLPRFWSEFWSINHSGYVTMKRSVIGQSGSSNWAIGSITRDQQGNIVSYNGTISILPPANVRGWLRVLLHEWTHLFQFWTPNYFTVVGRHVEAVADAFSAALIYETLGWSIKEYEIIGERDSGQLIWPLECGISQYLWAHIVHSYHLSRGWEKIWFYDQQAFKKLNSYIASLPISTAVRLRDAMRKALFDGYYDYGFDGLSAEDWLDGFSFFNSINDILVGSIILMWRGINERRDLGPTVQFEAVAMERLPNGAAVRVPISNYSITISDAQTRQILYSNPNYPAMDNGDIFFTNTGNAIPLRELLRFDIIAYFAGGENLTVTAYVARRANPMGDKLIFFLNSDGYTEGNGESNVGAIDDGFVRWRDGNIVEANITWNDITYTYVFENIIAHPNIPLTQIAVFLNESRTIVWPLTQAINPDTSAPLKIFTNPKVPSGNITIYHSENLVDWAPFASAALTEGYTSTELELSSIGTHYFKASWNGDETLASSNSSVVKVEVTTSNPIPPPTPTPTPPPLPSPTPPPSTPSPTPSPTPQPTPTPTTYPTPTPKPQQTIDSAPTPTPLQESTSIPDRKPDTFPTTLIATASGASATVVGFSILLFFKKRKR
jgi:hypothetical protein